jgi:hypothetical protein
MSRLTSLWARAPPRTNAGRVRGGADWRGLQARRRSQAQTAGELAKDAQETAEAQPHPSERRGKEIEALANARPATSRREARVMPPPGRAAPTSRKALAYPRLSREPPLGTGNLGASGGRDRNHGGRSEEGRRMREDGDGAPKSGCSDALAPVGWGAWQAVRGRSAASRAAAPATLLSMDISASQPA